MAEPTDRYRISGTVDYAIYIELCCHSGCTFSLIRGLIISKNDAPSCAAPTVLTLPAFWAIDTRNDCKRIGAFLLELDVNEE